MTPLLLAHMAKPVKSGEYWRIRCPEPECGELGIACTSAEEALDAAITHHRSFRTANRSRVARPRR